MNEKNPVLTLPGIEPAKAEWLKSKIRDVPDFPKPGILFKDLTTLWADAEAFKFCTSVLAAQCKKWNVQRVAGIEARGFIVGAAIADELKIGFLPIRKSGKLPYKTESITYDLEYGTDTLFIHVDAAAKGERIVIVDDLLATGGTAAAAIRLVQKIGADVVGIAFIVELGFLTGRRQLEQNVPVLSLIDY
jgi:adenine phosphoribosyltransferase